jgi:hypothetical protein
MTGPAREVAYGTFAPDLLAELGEAAPQTTVPSPKE